MGLWVPCALPEALKRDGGARKRQIPVLRLGKVGRKMMAKGN